ncbi:MAG: coagulation factor 5/8 type domain-containing protein, partial [Acidobacteriota bacterium]
MTERIVLPTIFGLLMIPCSGLAARGTNPNFGPNVLLFTPKMSTTAMQQQIDHVYAIQRRNEFGPQRNALLFLPGKYKVDVPIGFYTEVMGLGASPDDVEIDGNLHSDASEDNNNATTTFWRSAEGIAVNPPGGSMRWAVSQAAPFRRMHVR